MNGSVGEGSGRRQFLKYGEVAALALLACVIIFFAGRLAPSVGGLMAYLRALGDAAAAKGIRESLVEQIPARLVQVRAVVYVSVLVGGSCGVFFFWVTRLALRLSRERLVPNPAAGVGIEAIAEELRLSREAMKVWNRELERAVKERTRELEETNVRLAETWDRLLEAEKLASLGHMAAGIAHEMRNPLGIINTSAYYLRGAAVGADEESVEQLSIIEREVARMEKTISSLLSFARLSATYEPCLIGVNEVVAQAVEAVRAKGLPPGAVLELETAEGLPPVCVDPEQMRRVFINIIENGLQALQDGGGRVGVRSFAYDDMVAVEVADTGVGIPPEQQAKVFEPFYSTKPVGKGAGLGLAMARAIVGKADGLIELTSEPGRGSTFTVLLPHVPGVQ